MVGTLETFILCSCTKLPEHVMPLFLTLPCYDHFTGYCINFETSQTNETVLQPK